MHYQEYPKQLYRGADLVTCLEDTVTVADAEQEAAARADGYAMYVDLLDGSAPEADSEKDALRAQATGMGIAVDARWGVKRLQQEIAAKTDEQAE